MVTNPVQYNVPHPRMTAMRGEEMVANGTYLESMKVYSLMEVWGRTA